MNNKSRSLEIRISTRSSRGAGEIQHNENKRTKQSGKLTPAAGEGEPVSTNTRSAWIGSVAPEKNSGPGWQY